ncbi:MAG: tetratricopeptide repeat protein [Thermodesulfobacteriota bacterium]|nr:tetratricopeptide repeat protein [Thermodesulfobacteriota bacterium]
MSSKEKRGEKEDKKKVVRYRPFGRPSRNVEETLSIALQHHRAGRFKDAEYCYRQVLISVPHDVDVLCNLGAVLMSQGRFDEAAASLMEAISLDRGHAISNYNLGNVLKKQGKIEEAKDSYLRAVESDRSHAGAHFNIGNIYMEEGRLDEALSCFRNTISLDPGHIAAHLNMGNVLKTQGNIDEALASYRNVLAGDENNAAAYHNIGIILKIQGKIEEAIDAYNRAVEIEPGNSNAQNNLGNLLKDSGRIDEAIQCFRRAVELDNDNVSARHMLAALTGEKTEAAPRQYVRELYDRYADNFDRHLVEILSYDIPSVLRDMLYDLLGEDMRFNDAVDLGCGTGLAGEKIRPMTDRLEGIDISPIIIEKAEKKNIYDALMTGDIVEVLSESTEKYDLFVAADVFIYTGNLTHVFSSVKRCSKDKSHFAFSTEVNLGDDYILRPTGRYAHSFSYIQKLARQHGFKIVKHRPEAIRKEKGQEISGDVYILECAG